jgi:serine/threonine protein kinase
VKVLDFGLAKADSGVASQADIVASPTFTAHATAAGLILGTAAYMAPEQARGRVVDRRADIWAFGIVFFEMLSGTRPFSGETISEAWPRRSRMNRRGRRSRAGYRAVCASCSSARSRRTLDGGCVTLAMPA